MGICGGAFSPSSALCCPDASWAFCCALLILCERHRDHVYKPDLSPASYHCYECLCIQEKLFIRESWNNYKCSLSALPLNYWDILFFLSPSLPLSENVLVILPCLLFMLSSSLPWHHLPFLGTAVLRILIL